MTKLDKIKILRDSIGTYNLCRCFFDYDPHYWYFYILDVSDNLMLGVEEDDFMLDGLQIRKISDVKQIEIKNDLCVKINEANRLLDGIDKPQIDLSSWKSVFEYLMPLNKIVIVENEKAPDGDGFFYMGYVTDIKKSFAVFSAIDADGIRYDIEIPYSKITSVTFNDRYSQTWQKYLSEHNASE